MADDPVGKLTKSNVFWHLDLYPSRDAAQADKGPRSAVIEALGKFWLMTIGDKQWRPAHGNRVAEIGPIPIIADENCFPPLKLHDPSDKLPPVENGFRSNGHMQQAECDGGEEQTGYFW